LELEEARRLAETWIARLKACCCDRVDLVAGVYRGNPQPRDVDLVCQPKGGTRDRLRALNPVKEDRVRIVFNDQNRKVEVWTTSPEAYELTRWYRRLSKGRFIQLARKARRKGLRLSWRTGLQRNGETITLKPEEIQKILEE